MATDSPPAAKGLVLHSHARYYDLVTGLLSFGHGRVPYARLAGLARIAPGERVLDVGCGTGSLALAAQALVGAAGMVCGIDASAPMIERAQRKARHKGVPVDFRLVAAEALPFADGSFDAACSTLMLHHLPRPVRRQCVSEMARVLAPGGRALVVDYQAPSVRQDGWLARLHRHGAVAAEEVQSLLTDAGLKLRDGGPVKGTALHFTLAVRA